MKILGMRRGYVTNSSSANEWVPGEEVEGEEAPPTWPPGVPTLAVGEEIVITPMPAPDIQTPKSPPPTPQAATAPPQDPTTPAWSNAEKVGGLAGIIIAIFAVDRGVRWFINGRRK